MKKMRNQPPDPGILTPPMEDPSRASKFEPMPADFNIAGKSLNTCFYVYACFILLHAYYSPLVFS